MALWNVKYSLSLILTSYAISSAEARYGEIWPPLIRRQIILTVIFPSNDRNLRELPTSFLFMRFNRFTSKNLCPRNFFKTGRNPSFLSKYVIFIELGLSMDYWYIFDRSNPCFDLCLGAPKERQNLHFTKSGCNHRFRLMEQLFYETFKLLIIILERFDPFRPPLTPFWSLRCPKEGQNLQFFKNGCRHRFYHTK